MEGWEGGEAPEAEGVALEPGAWRKGWWGVERLETERSPRWRFVARVSVKHSCALWGVGPA